MALLKKKSEVVTDLSKQDTSKPKEKIAKKEANGKAQKGNGQSLLSWLYQPALVIVAVMALSIAAQEFLFVQPIENQQNEQSKAIIVQSLKQRIDQHVKDQVSAIETLAKNYLALSPEAQSAAVEALKSSNPNIDSIFVIQKQQSALLNELFPSLSFASIDVVRKIFVGKPVNVEAFFQNKNWFYQTAYQVDQDTIILAIFNIQSIKPLLALGANMPKGEASLVKGTKAIVTQGKGDTAEAITLRTFVPQWQVRYAPATSAKVVIDRTLFWSVGGGAAVIVAIIVFLLGRSRMNHIAQDLMLATQNLKTAVASEAKKAKNNKIHYAEINSMVALISNAAKENIKKVQQEKPAVAPSGSPAPTAPEKAADDAPLFDDDLLDLDVLAEAEETSASDPLADEAMVEELADLNVAVPQSIFRAYDIRGIVDDTLNEGIVELIGKALATEAIAQGQTKLCVGYDGRLSSIPFCEAITKGITSTGVDAVVIGQVPTPVLYFATHHLETGSGVMITGSHNPSNYNGFKMMLAGNTLSGDDIQKLYNRINMQDFAEGQGTVTEQSVDDDYLDYILNDIAIAAPLKVVVDAGNGVAGDLAPRLIEELGCEVIPLFCEVDGNFPNHHPDPGKPENLQDLINAVQEHDADIGLAFDGDGDRVGVVTNTGKIIWPDRLLMLFAKDVVSRNPGADIIYDVKCSRRLSGLISGYGGRPIMWKTGHSLIKAKMKETGALLAGEMSGHIFFKERWFGFDDGLYSAVRLLEILGLEDKTSEDIFAAFPEDVSTPEINVTTTDESKFQIIEKLSLLKGNFSGGNVSTIDGLRVDYPNGWGLCRASNTTPVLVLRFEADDENALNEIKETFKTQLASIEPSLDLNF